MSKITFGSRKLQQALKKYGESIEDEVKRVISETAYLIQSNARSLAPEDDGNLRKSIEVSFENGGLTGIVNVGAHYAVNVCRPCW